MKQEHDIDAWSLYWSQDQLHSCVAQSSDDDQKILNRIWREFAETLDSNSRVLDLATGNGAVASALLSANSNLEIDAVDKASIDPQKYLSTCDDLKSVNFVGDTDLLEMPDEFHSYQAITSQFGIEYAGLRSATMAALPRLVAGGLFQFIIHHELSEIIQSSKAKIAELEQLTQPSGLLETLIKMLGGKADLAQLEEIGKDYLERDWIRTQQLSGQVFAGIERVINQLNVNPKESIELGVAMDLRVRSELSRLEQLIGASQSSEDMHQWSEMLKEQNVEVDYQALYLDADKQDYLLAWLATGARHK